MLHFILQSYFIKACWEGYSAQEGYFLIKSFLKMTRSVLEKECDGTASMSGIRLSSDFERRSLLSTFGGVCRKQKPWSIITILLFLTHLRSNYR